MALFYFSREAVCNHSFKAALQLWPPGLRAVEIARESDSF
jgi:hypothetical protein